MNSLQKSVGKSFRFSSLGLGLYCLVPYMLVFSLSSCSTGEKDEEARPKLEEEVSIKADRSALDELRKDIPEEKRVENDEKALILELMGELKLHPSKVRSKWGTLVRKKRDKHRKTLKKWRSDYSRDEKKRREEFTKKAKKEREDFRRGKPDREKTKEFYADQDRERKEFFGNERDKRKEFESDVRSKSKEYDSYMREKNREFNEQHRLYYKRWQAREKEKRAAKQEKYRKGRSQKASAAQVPPGVDPQFVKDFEEMNNVPGTRLAPGSTKDEN